MQYDLLVPHTWFYYFPFSLPCGFPCHRLLFSPPCLVRWCGLSHCAQQQLYIKGNGIHKLHRVIHLEHALHIVLLISKLEHVLRNAICTGSLHLCWQNKGEIKSVTTAKIHIYAQKYSYFTNAKWSKWVILLTYWLQLGFRPCKAKTICSAIIAHVNNSHLNDTYKYTIG